MRISYTTVTAHLRQVYCTLDLRTLALFRVLFGSLLLFDVLRRIPDIEPFYTSTGLTPNHTLLWAPVTPRVFSLFFSLSYVDEVLAGFLLCALCYLALIAGFRTKLASVLSTVCCVSLHSRVTFLGNGGDEILNLLCVWSMLLPLGERFSLDALIKSRSPGWTPYIRKGQGFVSLVGFAIMLHISTLYFLNYIQKIGELWQSGLAVYYVLFQNHISTPLAVWLRFRMPVEISQVLTWGTLIIEGSAPIWLLSPVKNHLTRRIGVFLLASMHIGIALVMDLGIFSAAMVVYLSILLGPKDWDWIVKIFSKIISVPRQRAIANSLVAFLERVRAIPTLPPIFGPGLRALSGTAAAIVFITAVGIELLTVNPAIPVWMRPPRLAFFDGVVNYFRIGQLWVVFPFPPTTDETIVVDAVTVTGSHIDPLQYAARGWTGAPYEVLPDRLGLDSLWTNYLMRIDDRGMERYRGPLIYWILAHHERTGNPADRVVMFKVYNLIQETPPPGERGPPRIRKEEIARYPA